MRILLACLLAAAGAAGLVAAAPGGAAPQRNTNKKRPTPTPTPTPAPAPLKLSESAPSTQPHVEGEEIDTDKPGAHPTIAAGQRLKIKGFVTLRDADSFTITESAGGPVTVVALTPQTEVESRKRGGSHGLREYGASYILRGLRLEVDGVGNDQGQLVADKIRFDEQDLRTAQALQTTVDPVEAELREKLMQQQAEQEKLAGQLAETNAVVEANRLEAKEAAAKAQAAAEEAQRTADYANNRINGLDDFDPVKTITVNFRTGSATLSPAAKKTIAEAAAWVKTQNTKGWVVAVVGYADSSGNTARNRTLSEKRAQAVIHYIVTTYGTPMHRFVQPFGYGELEAAADNTTRAGRAKNRRVEIRLMVNKGIAGGTP